MANEAFLQGAALGSGIVRSGFEEYDRARSYRDKLNLQAQAHDDAAKALKTEADRYSDKLKLETGKEAREAASAGIADAEKKAQTRLLNVEADSVASGKGRYGAGGVKTGRDYSAVDRTNLIKSLSAMKSMGETTPEQDQKLNSLINIQAEASGATGNAPPPPQHQSVSFWEKLKGAVNFGSNGKAADGSPLVGNDDFEHLLPK